MEKPLLQVGFDKNGEMDFAIPGTIEKLDFKDMQEFRAMICVAISQVEWMWRRKVEAENPVGKVLSNH